MKYIVSSYFLYLATTCDSDCSFSQCPILINVSADMDMDMDMVMVMVKAMGENVFISINWKVLM